MIPQMTQGLNVTAFRSAGPAALQLNPNVGQALYRSFWQTGVASLDSRIITAARHPNPALRFALNGEVCPVHHGCLPALGFHLGEAMAQPVDPRNTGVEEVHRVVREQFGRWCKAFGTAVKAGRIIMRMCVGEALHVCRALGESSEGRLFTGPWSAEPLVLLDDGPGLFHAIEVSNLEDQLGLINVLCRTAPLLMPVSANSRTTPVIFSETLMTQPGEFVSSFRTNILGDPSFMALALGVVPVPYIHGFSSEYFGHHIMTSKVTRLAAQYTRIVWQATPHLDASTKLHFPEPSNLARVLYDLYYAMFVYEDVTAMRRAVQSASQEAQIVVQRRATLITYTRKSFVEVLISLAKRVSNSTDWSEAMDMFVGKVGNDRRLVIGGNHYQDLCALLVDSGLDYDLVPVYDERRVPDMVYLSGTPFEGWSDEQIGRVVWVALRVPVSAMGKLVGLSPAPGLQLNQRAPKALNYFTGIQVFRGGVARSEDDQAFEITSDTDDAADLVIVGRIPAWILLTDIANTTIALGAMVNGLSAPSVMQKLGMNMEIFSASASDASRVFFGSRGPMVDGAEIASLIERVLQPPDELPVNRVEVTLDTSTGAVASMTMRRDVDGEAARSRWTAQAAVEASLDGPTSAVLRTTCGTFEVGLGFPLPVLPSFKFRVARNSFYVEVRRLARSSKLSHRSPSSTSQTIASLAKTPQPFSGLFHSLVLSKLPLLPTTPLSRFDFVDMHGQFAFSDVERRNRDAHMNRPTHAQPLVEVKDDIFTMLLRSCGFIDNRPTDPVRIFALLDRDKGPRLDGLHALLFVGGLRLDAEGNTLVLDTYVLPWTDGSVEDVPNAGTTGDIPHPHAAAQIWDKMLVSFVERCRVWSHAPSCVPSGKLCACGAGADIAGFMANKKWQAAFGFKEQIYHAAIALPFAAYYLENVGGHMPDFKNTGGTDPALIVGTHNSWTADNSRGEYAVVEPTRMCLFTLLLI